MTAEREDLVVAIRDGRPTDELVSELRDTGKLDPNDPIYLQLVQGGLKRMLAQADKHLALLDRMEAALERSAAASRSIGESITRLAAVAVRLGVPCEDVEATLTTS